MDMGRRTKIMATVTDTRCTEAFVASLHEAGADGVRINSAHVYYDTLRSMVKTIRHAAPDMEILMDTKGPEIRTTENETNGLPLSLFPGQTWVLSLGGKCHLGHLGLNADPLSIGLNGGETVLLDDGAIELTVESVGTDSVKAVVKRGGELGSRKTVSIPGCDTTSLPAISERDARYIRLTAELGIDSIAHSFVRTPDDILAVRKMLQGYPVMLYAKIECRQALENLTGILDKADGLLIARGDLGTQIDFTSIPIIQHKIARLCTSAGKPTILATQMMQTMIENPIPTRAEISDIATAVMEGIGTLLLTGETAQGKYPTECIGIMRRTIEATEEYVGQGA